MKIILTPLYNHRGVINVFNRGEYYDQHVVQESQSQIYQSRPEDHMSETCLNYAGEFNPKGFEIVITPLTKKERKVFGVSKSDGAEMERAQGFITFKGKLSADIRTVNINRTQYDPDLGYLYIFQNDHKWYRVKYLEIS